MAESEPMPGEKTKQWPFGVRISLAFPAAVIAGLSVGGVCLHLPNRVRVFWLLAALVGAVCGWAGVAIGDRLALSNRGAVCLLAVIIACSAVVNYGSRSISTFARMEAIESDESRAARLFLQSMASETDDDSLLDPTYRWLAWRAKAFGPLEPPAPLLIALSEAAVCAIAAVTTAWILTKPAMQTE